MAGIVFEKFKRPAPLGGDDIFSASFCDNELIKFLFSEGFTPERTIFSKHWYKAIYQPYTPSINYDCRLIITGKEIIIEPKSYKYGEETKYFHFPIENEKFTPAYTEALNKLKELNILPN